MYDAVVSRASGQDIIIKCAAVADYRPAEVASHKIKKAEGGLTLALERTQDILSHLGHNRTPGQVICGFSMETRDLLENSRAKLSKKNVDMIVANDLGTHGAGFGHRHQPRDHPHAGGGRVPAAHGQGRGGGKDPRPPARPLPRPGGERGGVTAWSGSIWRHGPGGSQYRYFRSLDRPQYDLCARLDVTRFCAFMKARGGSSYHAMGYFVVRAANGVPAFRMRIREGRPLLHERVNPSFTEPRADGELFKCVGVEWCEDLGEFLRRCGEASARQGDRFLLDSEEARDDYLYLSCLPWVDFTSVSQAGSFDRDDAVPTSPGGNTPARAAGDNAAFGDGAPRLLRRHPCGAVFRRAPADAGRALNPDIHPCEGRDPHAASGARRRGERGAEL